ncbi:hypothetical protein [Streptomyces sp. NBC_01602]|uniref:hypothetical protein n=1 Tax=Streptomyces sp. NBC_01602 TaxID=2975893 RepID=UPI003870850A
MEWNVPSALRSIYLDAKILDIEINGHGLLLKSRDPLAPGVGGEGAGSASRGVRGVLDALGAGRTGRRTGVSGS